VNKKGDKVIIMKFYKVAIAKEYGSLILEYTYQTLEDATNSFEKYKDFYFRALVEIDCSKKKPTRKLLRKYINGKDVN
jgi:hypothetical protein